MGGGPTVISDLLIAFFLALAGFIYVAVTQGELGIARIFGALGAKTKSAMRSLASRRGLLKDSFYQLILFGLLMIMVGQVRLIVVYGPHQFFKLLANPSSANLIKDIKDCLVNQERVCNALTGEAKKLSRSYEPGVLYRAEKWMRCPHGGGEYVIDENGILYCKKHGKKENPGDAENPRALPLFKEEH